MRTQPAIPGDMKKNASFVITISQALWIKDEARRRGVSEALIVRELIDRAMTEVPTEHQEVA